MQSIVSVTTAPERTALTTVDRVKLELSITTDASDALLGIKINEASSDIEAHLSRTLAYAGLTQTFWGEGTADYLILDRAPVGSIVSVTLDDDLVDSDEYRLDADSGILYRLDSSGYPCTWYWCKSVIIVFTGGYELPGADDPTLPPAIEAAAVELVTSYWTARGRDPTVRAEDIPGIGSVTYWVGAVGEDGGLPPSVTSKIAPFRRVQL